MVSGHFVMTSPFFFESKDHLSPDLVVVGDVQIAHGGDASEGVNHDANDGAVS